MPRKVCVVVTARPSYSRIRSVLRAVDRHPGLELQLVVAASALLERYGNVSAVVEQDGFDIAARVFMIVEGENLVTSAKSTGLGLVELATVLDNLKPDVVISVADRFETLATAVAASYMNLPLAHVQGGEVTGSIDEKVRHAVTKLADLHFVATEKAGERVRRLGERQEAVFCTGCPSIDLAAEMLERPEMDFDPVADYGGVGAEIDLERGYVVVMQHPVTTEFGAAGRQVGETLTAVRELGLQALWFWPNVDAGSDDVSKMIRVHRERNGLAGFHFFRNMEPLDFLKLIHHSRCIVGNSSVAIREASFLGVPAVNIGSRQLGRERGRNVIDVPYQAAEIKTAIAGHLRSERRPEPDHLYGDGRAGERIAEILSTCPLSIEKRLTY